MVLMISHYLPGFTASAAQETKAETLVHKGNFLTEFVWPPVKSYSQFSAKWSKEIIPKYSQLNSLII